MGDTIPDTIADGRKAPPAKPDAWLIVFGDRGQFRKSEVDEDVARRSANGLGGQALPLALMAPALVDSEGSGAPD